MPTKQLAGTATPIGFFFASKNFLDPFFLGGAFQVLKRKRLEGILKFAFFGVFLMTTIVIAAYGIFDTGKSLSDYSCLLGIFEK